MVAATVASGPRYAPHDPSLPEPWRALVDGNTGYIYYWNPETNVTQYEKPAPPPPPPPPPPLPAGPPPAVSTPKLAPIPANPSLHSQNSAPVGGPSHVEQSSRSGNERVDANNNTNNSIINNGVMPGQPKLAAIPVPRSHQGMGEMRLSHAPTGQLNAPGTSVGLGTRSAMFKRGPNDYSYPGQDFKRPRMHGFSDTPNASDVEAYRRQHEITAMGENVPAPFMTFDVAGFPPEILRELQNAGFSCPTPIQAQSWPVALQSRDIVAIAKTGSGKTLGYLLPAFLHLGRRRNNSQMGPTVLVLAPTRELATQIQDEAVKFGRSSRITSTCVYGGAPKVPQLRDLERGADIVVATPGRLNDFLEVKKVNLQQVSFLVLDEADRMLDMGFEPQIRKIVNEIPPQRQTLMYTATWPKEVRKIAGDLLVNPVQVHIGSVDELSANKSITQYVEVVAVNEKQRRLEQILRSQEPGSKVIIFCSTKRMCDQLSRSIGRQFGAAAIHGDKSQTERDWVLTQFRTGRTPVLVATDVAARGLDIKDIRVVINFDFPTGIEDYVHRIGRTGRAGATGLSYTFFSDQDAKYAQELIKVLEGANQRVPPDLRDMAARSGYMRARGGRWDSGGRTGRDGGRVGRGDGSRGGRGDGGRGYGGGRGEVYGVRGGGWGRSEGRSDRQERSYDRFGGHGRFERDARNRYESVRDRYDRDGRDRHEKDGRDRYFDDRDRLRDGFRKFDDRERGRSYSRSYSRSPSRSRGRSYSRSWGRSYSRSRSRSRSYDRYNHKSISRRGSSPVNVTVNSTLNAGPPERNDSPRNVPPRVFSPRKGSSPHTLVSTYRDVSPPGNRTPHRVDPSHQVGSEYCDDLSYADGSPPRSRH